MDERPDYFGPLFGVMHAPRGEPPEGASPAVLMAAPLGDEMRASRRALVEIARALAAAGRWVLRFDYSGTGDSARSFEDVTLARCREDMARMAEVLRDESSADAVDLVGVRVGASLCLKAADELKAGCICAVSPVIQGAKEFRAILMRRKLRQKMTEEEGGAAAQRVDDSGEGIVDIDGLAYSRVLIDELQAMDLTAELGEAARPTLLFQVGPRKSAAPELEKLAEALRGRASVRVVHRPPFWARLEHADVSDVTGPVIAFLSGTAVDDSVEAESP